MKRILAALCGLLLAAGLLTTASTPAATASAGCAPDIGQRTPVLLVHGFLSDEATWNKGHPSMIQALGQVEGLYVRTFDYSRVNTHWVTDPDIGPALADRIACLAAASRQAGGPGKVVIVAHSMGGLATRYAASLASDGRRVGSLLGLVVTVGTPHLGSFLMAELSHPKLYADEHTLSFLIGASCGAADVATFGALPDEVRKLCDMAAAGNSPAAFAMTPGSRELRELPPMPSAVPVRAIADSIDQVSSVVNGVPLQLAFVVPGYPRRIEASKVGDLVVKEASATAQHSAPGAGGGTAKVHCDNFVLPLGPLPDCWHLEETSNPLVEQFVVASIKQYLAALTLTPPPTLCGRSDRCRQVATADVDGDGKSDQIGVARLADSSDGQQNWTLRVLTATGRLGVIKQGPDTIDGEPFFGAAEIDGVAGAELLMRMTSGPHSQWFQMYTWRGTKLIVERNPDISDGYQNYGWVVDSAISEVVGLTCERSNGSPSITLTSLTPQSQDVFNNPSALYAGEIKSWRWSADRWLADGARPISMRAGTREFRAVAGWHCAGLPRGTG